ncbi:protocadherin alpha 2 [Chelydra serpentina]|uniref:Protocadherin alpha 2 n=1 Tax=Chelydra serpentina TaxID=8475 RepID=A0A8T1S5H6_CHESE|nr:protocadherin alpha 2 [Chelydra serpentina]
MALLRRGSQVTRQLLRLVLLHTAWEVGSGQVRYSVPEESKHGTFVGRLAQDLGLEVAELVSRMFRMVSKGRRDYFEVNLQNGVLFVNSRVDREELCGQSPLCAIDLEVIVDKPLRIFHVEVEIQDINDNAPVFTVKKDNLFIPESRLPDSRFPLEGASDADIGTNSLLTYKLSSNDYFFLDVQINSDLSKSLGLVLKTSLDREETTEHHVLLTATDGGKPELTGTVQLVITVLDVNDNAPAFNQSVYEVKILEGTADGTLIMKLNATDLDDGINKNIRYFFNNRVPSSVKEMFSIDQNTGEFRVKDKLDFEDTNLYEIQIETIDKGTPQMAGHCTILVEILDVNDNAPELAVTSFLLPVPEDSPPGTVVALVSVSDRDSGDNGKVTCSIPPNLPFQLVSTFKNYHSLVLAEAVDRERVSEYKILVTARDEGAPSLSASSSILVPIADVNDNAPAFPQPVYTVFVKENNPPGAHLFSVSASDPDLRENALVSYSVVERSVGEQQPLSSYISVHSESGHIYALQPFDYEELQVLQFQVSARDAGFPRWPELVPLSAGAGHVVGKVRAVDADSGYNAWLRYEVQEPGAAGPFRVGVYSGEISTTRALEEADGPSQRLVILVRDHGEPALSATATVSLSLAESPQAVKWDSRQRGGSEGSLVDMNVSLMIAICSVSGLFVLVIVVYVGLRCHPGLEVMCGPGKATVVCSSEVGSWSYCQRQSRNLCVGEGTAKNDLMVFSPNFPNSAASGEKEKQQEMMSNLCGTLLQLVLLHTAWEVGSGQVRYSVPEESKHGTFVGRLAQDLGLEVAELVSRMFRMVSKGRRDYFEVNLQNGVLFVNSRVDREELCGQSPLCAIDLEVIVDKPLRIFHVEVEIQDINDNAPVFSGNEKYLSIAESRLPDSRVPLEGASDADIGTNSLLTYKLSPNEHFTLNVKSNNDDNKKSLVLVLKKPLDREETPEHHLLLTATDAGKPKLTGTIQLVITVLDANDNAPVFNQTVYKIRLFENAANGTLVIKLNATDLDEGSNKDVSYIFSSFVTPTGGDMFSLDPNTGEVTVKSHLDFEEINVYDIQVEVKDKGNPPLSGHCNIELEVLDVNDNAPQLAVTSLSLPVREDSPPGTVPLSAGAGHVVGKIRAVDADSGYNAWLRYEVQEPGAAGPFRVGVYSGEISTTRALEETDGPSQRLVILVRDHGEPALSATATVSLSLVESPQAVKWDSRQRGGSEGSLVDMNVSLMIAICSVSGLFVLVIVVYVGLRCHPGPEVMCEPGKATVVCSSEVGSWSYSQRQSRNLCVGEGTAKNDLMVFSPNFPNSAANGDKEKQQEMTPNLCGTVSDVLVFLNDYDFLLS